MGTVTSLASEAAQLRHQIRETSETIQALNRQRPALVLAVRRGNPTGDLKAHDRQVEALQTELHDLQQALDAMQTELQAETAANQRSAARSRIAQQRKNALALMQAATEAQKALKAAVAALTRFEACAGSIERKPVCLEHQRLRLAIEENVIHSLGEWVGRKVPYERIARFKTLEDLARSASVDDEELPPAA